MPDFIDLLDWAAGTVDHSCVGVTLSLSSVGEQWFSDRPEFLRPQFGCVSQTVWSIFHLYWSVTLCLSSETKWLTSANHSGPPSFPTCGAFYSELSLAMSCDFSVFRKLNLQTVVVATLNCIDCPHFSSAALVFVNMFLSGSEFSASSRHRRLSAFVQTWCINSEAILHHITSTWNMAGTPLPLHIQLPTCLSAAKQKSNSQMLFLLLGFLITFKCY